MIVRQYLVEHIQELVSLKNASGADFVGLLFLLFIMRIKRCKAIINH